jgi:hypothetical protein
MGTLPMARVHGPPHFQGAKATEGEANRQCRRRGGRTLYCFFRVASSLTLGSFSRYGSIALAFASLDATAFIYFKVWVTNYSVFYNQGANKVDT